MSEAYIREVELPSKGQFYEGKVPGGIVTLEPMGTREEKLFSSGSSSVVNKVFDQCLTLPDGIRHTALVLGDRLYILLQLRSISYGDDYTYPFRCTECGEKSYATLNISEIPVKYASEGSSEIFPVHLPLMDVQLEVRLLTGQDEEKVQAYVKQLSKKFKQAVTVEYTYRLARRIETIDGEPVGIREAMDLVEKIKGKDSLVLRDAIEENDVGPEVEVEPECPNCSYPNEPIALPLQAEFFRPRRRSPKPDEHIRAAEAIDGP